MSLAGAMPARASEIERTTESAVFLLRQSVSVGEDDRHERLLEALRHLRDPALRPFFARIAGADTPALRIHGILGEAELREPEPGLELLTLAEIEHPAVQVRLISAALDRELLSLDAAAELLDWADLDRGVKLLVALQLIEHGRLEDTRMLRDALGAERLARRGLAGLMLHQLGEPVGTEVLQRLNEEAGPQRDPVRLMLIRAALRHELHRAGTWGYAVTTEPEVSPGLRLAALRLALRFGDPRAATLWQERFESTEDVAERSRLALTALELAPWLEPGVFEVMAAVAEEESLSQMARVGLAITEGSPEVADRVVELIEVGHPMANAWALRYARDHARPSDAQLVLLGLVLAYERGPERGRARRLDDAVQAARVLHELDPGGSRSLLRPILVNEATDRMLVRGILLGLVRARAAEPHRVIEDIPTFNDTRSDHLALLLRARHGEALDDGQMRRLGLLVRGGGELQGSLRIQAAWAWLKRAGRAEAALNAALRDVR